MGYTHYWYRPARLPRKEWEQYTIDARVIISSALAAGFQLGDGAGEGAPVVTDDSLSCACEPAPTDRVVSIAGYACNAAQEANPENPIAAAKALPSLLYALREATEYIYNNTSRSSGVNDLVIRCRSALAQVDEG